MKTFARTLLAILAVAIVVTPRAFADDHDDRHDDRHDHPVRAPEIDPALGVGLLVLLGGAVTVIRGRIKA